jgi:glutamine amidotransferase
MGETEYERRFASVCGRDNIIGVQFHPEKSQASGLKLLNNFAQM